ncbi:MAG: fumarylacetoacetate hydrolase family protein [Burkholderiales bacterium]|jgi:5-carboxymethyl-2-hydroxymuconate isomerase
MKLLSFEIAGQQRFGAVVGDGVIDLTGRLGAEIVTLRALLEANLVGRAAELAAGSEPDFALAAMKFLTPIPFPEKILCVGVNYGNRNAEYKDGSDLPKWPSLFPRFPGSFVGHGRKLLRPPESPQLDYEGEIAIIIGKTGRRIAEKHAENYIAGLTCLNEGTIRDWTRHGKFNVTQGKNFDASGAIGPWMVTADEFKGYDELRVRTRVNGELRQDDTTANLMFSFRYLLSYISTWTTLRPGDVISTGTPVGAGVRFDPPRFLKPGDTVEVEVSGVGTLANTVADEN